MNVRKLFCWFGLHDWRGAWIPPRYPDDMKDVVLVPHYKQCHCCGLIKSSGYELNPRAKP